MNENKKMKILIVAIAIVIVILAGAITLIVNQIKAKEALLTAVDAEETIDTVEVVATPEVASERITPMATVTPALKVGVDAFEEASDNVFINGEDVNLRKEPSETAVVVAVVKKSTLLKRVGLSEEWSRLVYEGQECYVANDLITETMPEEATSGIDDPEVGGDPRAQVSLGDKVVIIDPGHQGRGDSTQEPIGPGASKTKARVTSGTSGRVSGWAEYELNLAVSLKLRDELVGRGYTVYMTRENHDINISNKERAEFATNQGGDILVRIHANGSENPSVKGALCMAPTNSNLFLAGNIISESQRLSRCIIDKYVAATGFNNQGVYPTDEMSGINWSTIPVTIMEMGYMSNASDDAAMADPDMQTKMVKGMSDGIDSYFAGDNN